MGRPRLHATAEERAAAARKYRQDYYERPVWQTSLVAQSTEIRYRNKKMISVKMAAKYKARRVGKLNRKQPEPAKMTQLWAAYFFCGSMSSYRYQVPDIRHSLRVMLPNKRHLIVRVSTRRHLCLIILSIVPIYSMCSDSRYFSISAMMDSTLDNASKTYKQQ